MIEKFHHITTDLEHDGYFYPRIPHETFHFENKTIYRTCVSTTVIGCLSAFPYITDLVDEKAFYIKVFEIIPSEVGITEKDILPSHFLYEKGYLHDAIITDEHWITKPFTVPSNRQKFTKSHGWKPPPI